jgi:4a-hydroxytetrahydrobiopterin dehydratase
MISELAHRECVPCKGGMPPLKGQALADFFGLLGNDWNVIDEQALEKEYRFKNFRLALDFTNRIGELAESVDHHPDLELGWGRVKVRLLTHKIGGLSETDFVFAAKVDALPH